MSKLLDYEHHYKGYHGCASKCRIRIFRGVRSAAGKKIVIATELEDNEGTSVTNYAERIATEIMRANRIDPASLIWVEHYQTPHFEESFDLVTFEINSQGEFMEPKWRRIGPEIVELWTDEKLESCGEPDEAAESITLEGASKQ